MSNRRRLTSLVLLAVLASCSSGQRPVAPEPTAHVAPTTGQQQTVTVTIDPNAPAAVTYRLAGLRVSQAAQQGITIDGRPVTEPVPLTIDTLAAATLEVAPTWVPVSPIFLLGGSTAQFTPPLGVEVEIDDATTRPRAFTCAPAGNACVGYPRESRLDATRQPFVKVQSASLTTASIAFVAEEVPYMALRPSHFERACVTVGDDKLWQWNCKGLGRSSTENPDRPKDQQFVLRRTGSGHVQLWVDGRCLARDVLTLCNPLDEQQWFDLRESGDGRFYIEHTATKDVLDAWENVAIEGKRVGLHRKNGQANQQFWMLPFRHEDSAAACERSRSPQSMEDYSCKVAWPDTQDCRQRLTTPCPAAAMLPAATAQYGIWLGDDWGSWTNQFAPGGTYFDATDRCAFWHDNDSFFYKRKNRQDYPGGPGGIEAVRNHGRAGFCFQQVEPATMEEWWAKRQGMLLKPLPGATYFDGRLEYPPNDTLRSYATRLTATPRDQFLRVPWAATEIPWRERHWVAGQFANLRWSDAASAFDDGGYTSIEFHLTGNHGLETVNVMRKIGSFSKDDKWFAGHFRNKLTTSLAKVDGNVQDVYTLALHKPPIRVEWLRDLGIRGEASQWVAGDFDGNGLTDLARIFDDGGLASIDVVLTNPDGEGSTRVRWGNKQGDYTQGQRWLAGDFNGDGHDDLANVFDDRGLASIDVHLSTGAAFTFVPVDSGAVRTSRWLHRAGPFVASPAAGQWLALALNEENDGIDIAHARLDNGRTTIAVYLADKENQRFIYDAGGGWAVRDGAFGEDTLFLGGKFNTIGSLLKVSRDRGGTAVELFSR